MCPLGDMKTTRREIITIEHRIKVWRWCGEYDFMRVYDFAADLQFYIAQLRVRSHSVDEIERGDAVAGILVVCLRQKVIGGCWWTEIARRLSRVVLNLLTLVRHGWTKYWERRLVYWNMPIRYG